MSILQRRLVRVAAAAVAVVALAALPTGAKASLINDPFTMTAPEIPAALVPSVPMGFVDIISNATVGAGPEFSAGDMSNWDNFLTDIPSPPISTALRTAIDNSSYFIDVDATGITFFWDFTHQFSLAFTGLDWLPPDGPGTITSVTDSVITGGGTITATTTFGDEATAQFDCIGSGGCGGGSTFRLEITAAHDPLVSAVPLPAALPLFLSALAGLGLMGWRRRQADA